MLYAINENTNLELEYAVHNVLYYKECFLMNLWQKWLCLKLC